MPEGLLVATFADGTSKTTELPNVCLDSLCQPKSITGEKGKTAKGNGKAKEKAKEKKGKGKAKGKKAAKGKEKSTGHSLLYGVMWYKNQKCIGIRAKTGKKNQVTSFGGKSIETSKVEMKNIGYHVCNMLEIGNNTTEAKKEGERLMHS